MLPPEAGFVLTDERQYIVLETHYDNPKLASGMVDSSGVRFYYTDTLREHEAGTLTLGDGYVSRGGSQVVSGVDYEHTCPKQCTERFSTPINVFKSGLHMHTTGKEMYTNLYDEDNNFLRTINKVSYPFCCILASRFLMLTRTRLPVSQGKRMRTGRVTRSRAARIR